MMTEIQASLGIYDYSGNKICDLYDSQNKLKGQAFGIIYDQPMKDGIKQLSFSIPYMVNGEENFRWQYLKNEYQVRFVMNGNVQWYILDKPKKTKNSNEIIGEVVCNGAEILLKTKNIYLELDDTNGIGTISYLMDLVLKGTGWHRGYTDPLLEEEEQIEKIRTLTSGGKDGALGLISKICSLFRCYVEYDSNQKLVNIYNYNHREQVLEGVIGQNINALSVDYDSSNVITRLYVEGEYGDNGYVGIDEVNPTGLNFLMNFDYYRSLGLITSTHDAAIAQYITDVSNVKSRIRANTQCIIQTEDEINTLVGQCVIALYYVSDGFTNPRYTYGNPTQRQKELRLRDEVVIMQNDGKFRRDTIISTPGDLIRAGDYGIAKFGIPASGLLGAKEVQIEAKENEISKLENKIAATTKEDKKAEYRAEIAQLQTEIDKIYNGDSSNEGLYSMMHSIMKSDGKLYLLDWYDHVDTTLQLEQDEVEADFIVAMGNLLRDGYWSNQNYVPGQEQYLYNDAKDMMSEMSRPTVTYKFNYVRIVDDFHIPMENIRLNDLFRINDDDLQVYDNLFITRIKIGIDDYTEGSIEVSNKDITLASNDLGNLLNRMSQLADLIEQKNAIYDRAKAISKNGTFYADRLNGQINVLTTQLLSTVSNWHTDEQGNILFESADGGSAMMLCGAGFMIANSMTEAGEWDWRTKPTIGSRYSNVEK